MSKKKQLNKKINHKISKKNKQTIKKINRKIYKKNIKTKKNIQFGGIRNKELIFIKYGAALNRIFAENPHGLNQEQLPLTKLPDFFISTKDDRTFKYLEWIVKSFTEGGFNKDFDISKVYLAIAKHTALFDGGKLKKDAPITLEDIRESIEELSRLNGNPINILSTDFVKKRIIDETIIDNFCGLNGCKIGNQIKPGLLWLLNTRDHKTFLQDFEEDIKPDKMVYKDDAVTIYLPTTKKKACAISKGSKWCTVSTGEKNMFKNYSSQGPLYIIKPKNPTIIVDPKNPANKYTEKYQIHNATREYMDVINRPIDFIELMKKFPSLFVKTYESDKLTMYGIKPDPYGSSQICEFDLNKLNPYSLKKK